MNFGNCPYCDGFLGFFEVPSKTPAYTIVKCELCNKDVWYRLSRIDPKTWTIEGFEKEFIVDEKNGKIIERNPKPKKEMSREDFELLMKLIEQRILFGDPSSKEKPVGVLSTKDL